jgi:hypothetical protein
VLKEQLAQAKAVWLPLWAHPHYDSYVEPVSRIYRDVRYRLLALLPAAACTAMCTFVCVLGPQQAGSRLI